MDSGIARQRAGKLGYKGVQGSLGSRCCFKGWAKVGHSVGASRELGTRPGADVHQVLIMCPSCPLADDAFGEEPCGTAARRGRQLRGLLPDASRIGPGSQVSPWAGRGQLRAVRRGAPAIQGPSLSSAQSREAEGPSG